MKENNAEKDITPGFWRAVKPMMVASEEGDVIARLSSVDVGRVQRDANLAVIAAVPEMLKLYDDLCVELCLANSAGGLCRNAETGELQCERRQREGTCPAEIWREKLSMAINKEQTK